MKRMLILLALLFGACAEEGLISEQTYALNAGSAAISNSTTLVAPQCDQMNTLARKFLDDNTPGWLVCGGSASAAHWSCKTEAPPIIYSVDLRSEQYSGNVCTGLLRIVKYTQSNDCFQIGCSSNGGANATCKKYGCFANFQIVEDAEAAAE